MATFAWEIQHYPDLADYESALLLFTKPSWIKSITIHHTWKPTRGQWAGRRTMESMGEGYARKGWPSGPHLFLAAGTSADGIWAGTPLAVPGTHAGGCNADHIGVEVVGNYDIEPWPAAVERLVYDVVLLLMRWGNIPAERVHGHRECLPNKSCPGSMINMDSVRKTLENRLVPRYRLPRHPYFDKPHGTQLGYLNSYTEYGIREVTGDGWGHLADGTWTPIAGLELVR